MRQRIDIEDLWRSARKQSLLAYDGVQQQVVAALPSNSAIAVDDLLADDIDSSRLVERLQQATKPPTD
jgi:hypothetical protein